MEGIFGLFIYLYELNDANFNKTLPLAATVTLLAIASGCSPNQPPQAAPAPPKPSAPTQNQAALL